MALRSAASRRRRSLLSSVSRYNACATAAGPHVCYTEHFNVELAPFIPDAKHIAHSDFARRLGFHLVGTNPAQVTSFGREGARFEETGGPKPLVNSYGFFPSLNRHGITPDSLKILTSC